MWPLKGSLDCKYHTRDTGDSQHALVNLVKPLLIEKIVIFNKKIHNLI